jgi:hypothetical protein
MSITRIQNNQITDSTIVAYAKLQSGSLTGNLFAPTVTLNSNVTINGNLFLANTGNTTTINATNTYINDPLVVFNNGYSGSLSGYDIGMLINRNLTSIAPYGSVNSAWVWVENDQAFESLMTTDTGTGSTSINNSGFANVKTGNTTMVSGTVTGTLGVTGATTLSSTLNVAGATAFTTATGGGLQAVAIGNVTPGTGVFTTGTFNTATTGGLQAVAIGNVTPGTGVFTTGTFNTATTGGLQAVAIGNVTPGTGAFTTLSATGASTLNTITGASFQGVIGNVTPAAGTFTTGTFNTATTGGLQAVAIGNVTPGTGAFTTLTGGSFQGVIGNVTATTGFFTTLTATTVNAATIGNVGTNHVGTGTSLTALTGANVNGTVSTANATVYTGITNTSTGTYYPLLGGQSTTGNTAAAVNSSLNYNAATGALSATSFVGSGAGLTGVVATNANVAYYDVITPLSNNQTYYIPFANVTNGNSILGAVSGVNVNPSTSTINALAFVGGSGTFTVANITNTTNNTGAGTGAFQVAGGAYIAGNLWVGGNINATVSAVAANNGQFYGNAAGAGALYAGITSGFATLTDTTIQSSGNLNSFIQINNQNINGGAQASADYVATANNGSQNDTYIDMGIASSTYNYPGFTLIKPNDGYLIAYGNTTTGGGNLVLTSSLNDIVFAAGGSNANNEFGRITAGNVFVIKSTTQATGLNTGAVQVAGGMSVGANLYVGGNLSVNGTVTYLNTSVTQITGTEVVAGTIFANSGASATNTTSGALQVTGGAGFTGAIYAGSIQNTPIGGTTASSGNFTTLNATSGLTASTVQAATIGNVGAVFSGASATLSGTLIAATVNAATIGNTGAVLTGASLTTTGTASVGTTLTATTVNAATIGNTGATLTGATLTTSGTASVGTTLTATTINAATIGNVGAVFSGASETLSGTLIAATVNAATIGNIGANVVGTGTYLTALTGTNVNGTVATANVAIYEQITPLNNNQTYYVPFANVTNGNSTLGAVSSFSVNPSTGNVSATAFVGSGAYLTNLNGAGISGVASANVSTYTGVTNNTSGSTYYPMLSGQSTTGNTQAQVNGSLSYVPSTGALTATSFNGIGTFSTATTSSTLIASGNIVAAATTATNDNNTGSIVAKGGIAAAGNINIGGQQFVGAGSQSTVLTGAITVARGTSVTGPGTQYTQAALINATNTGSSDYIAYGNNYPGPSNDHGWMDLGFTGDAFSDPVYSITKANDGYLFASGANSTVGGNLVMSTDSTGSYNDIVIGVGSFYANSEVARFHGNTSNSGTFVIKLPTNNNNTANTGALQVWGGASFSSNVYHGGATILNGSQTAGYDTIIKGNRDNTLIWARPNATYDAVIIGNSAVAATVVNGAKLQINTNDSILLPVGTNAQRPSASGLGTDTAGMLRYSSTANAIEWYTGSSWQAASSNFTVIADQQFNGTGSQTIFTLSTSQTTASCIVSINGVLQIPTLAYSVSGTTLTFTEAPASGDVIDVRMLTTTATVTGLSDTSGYNTVNVITGTGVTFTTGAASQITQYTIDTNGGFVTNGSNVTVASAGTSVIDNLYANSYSSAKYTITATLQGTNIREITELLMIHNGGAASAGTATVMSYGRVNTAGNTLVTYGATTTGNIAQLQATTTNANTILRIKRDYMAI